MTGNVYLRQWLILSTGLLLLGGAMAWNLYSAHEAVETRERERLANQAVIVEKNVAPQLLLANRVIDSIIKKLPEWRADKGGLSHANGELRLIKDALVGIRTILVIDAQGAVTLTSNPALNGQNVSQRDYFQKALKNPNPGIFHVSAPFKTVLGNYAISMFRVLPGPRGGLGGIVIVGAGPEFFTTLLDSVRYADDMRVSIIHGDGRLFVVAPSQPGIENINVAGPGTFFERHMDSGQKASSMTGRMLSTGELRMVAMRTIQPDQLEMDKPLVMNLNRDLESIFAGWRRDAFWQAEIFLILVTVCIAGLFLYQRKTRENERLKSEQMAERERAEINFRAILEACPVPMVVNDDRHNVIYLNAAFTRTLGYRLDDIPTLTQWWPRAYPDPAYRQWVAEAWENYLNRDREQQSQFPPLEINICCKDGSVRTVQAEVDPIVFAASGNHLVSFYDITERKAAENAMRLSNNLLQATLDAIPDLLFEIDIEGRIFNYHAHRRDLLAAPPEIFLGKTFADILPPEPAQICLAAIREAAEQGWSTGKEYLLHLPHGDFWFELSVAPMKQITGEDRHYIVLARDVTERKRLREQLLAFLENSAVVAYIVDEDNRYTFISDNYMRTFGLRKEQIIGKTHHEIFPPEIADAYLRNNLQAVSRGGVVEAIEPGPMNDGSWWLSNKFLFKDAQGQTMLGGLSVNISMRVHDEQERLEKERAHRITLVREVHHRIKNNLQSVAGLLRRELGQFTESQPRLETAISQVNVIAVIHGLQGIETREATRLLEVVRSICKSVGDLRQREIAFPEPPLDTSVRHIEIDKDEAVSVALVINELVLNAVKHSPEGAVPQVELCAMGDGARLVISNATKDEPTFDIKSGLGISMGLSLVRSLLPEQGAQLTYATDLQGRLSAILTLAPPTMAIDVPER